MSQKIFISYSHKDEKWKDLILEHILLRTTDVEIWSDEKSPLEPKWQNDIEETLLEADVVILLISTDYLISGFVIEYELPLIWSRLENEGLVVLPVIVRPSPWKQVKSLRRIQVFPKHGAALSEINSSAIDKVLDELASSVVTALEIAANRRRQEDEFREPPPPQPPPRDGDVKVEVDFFISHSHKDGDFAELLKHRIESRGYRAWIDTERLAVGVEWREEIDQSITNAAALIVIMSPEARESEYVTYEWVYAWGTGIPVVPIMLHQTLLHPRLDTLQYLDFENRRARPWSRLMQALDQLAKAKLGQTTSP